MSKIKLCIGTEASKPYYVKEIQTNLYSMEELCFCLWEHATLFDATFLREDLLSWMKEECGMEGLTKELEQLVQRDGSLHSFVRALMTAVSYKSEAEIELMEKKVEAMEEMNPYSRQKRKGDHLFLSGNFMAACNQYLPLADALEKQGSRMLDEIKLLADIYHNIATCMTRMFYYEIAATYYEKAYEVNGNDEERIMVACCKRLCLSMPEYEEFKYVQARDYKSDIFDRAEERVNEIMRQSQSRDMTSHMELQLKKWTNEYKSCGM